MPRINLKVSNNPKKEEVVTGFLGGLNVFQDQTLIRDAELTEAKNIILSVDGIEPRPGILRYGTELNSRVMGGIGFYTSTGTREFIRFSGGRLQKYVAGTPTNIGSQTYDTSALMNLLLVRDKVYTFNGVDPLTYYDGTTITPFAALITPVGLAVSPQGTTGAEPYSYRISAFNAQGETLACSSVSITTGNATLNATNYNQITWTAVSGAVGYNVWGRKATGLGHTYMASVYTNAYNDKGQDTPSTLTFPQEGNQTLGIIGSMGVFAIGRIFVAGDPTNPSRLYFGGVGSNINNFTTAPEGGGSVDVFKNDGSIIRSILPFQGGVIVWKDNAVYKFSFNSSGFPQLEEITRSFGGISFRSCKHVENDVVFAAKKDGRLAFYSLGNQENYSSAILRTNELSIKVASRLTDVNVSRIQNSSAFYFNNIYGCSVATSGSTTNSRIWCLDTRFGAWVYWDDLDPNFFMDYVDTDGTQKLYYGDETSGYMQEMFRAEKSDNGAAISVLWTTKSFNQKLFHRFKRYYTPTVQFKDVSTSGAVNGQLYLDGTLVSAGFNITVPTAGGAGIGADLIGFALPGQASGGVVNNFSTASDVPVEIETVETARSIKYSFNSDAVDARYKFLSVAHTYKVLAKKRLSQQNRVYPT